jgi:hypothetical protein
MAAVATAIAAVVGAGVALAGAITSGATAAAASAKAKKAAREAEKVASKKVKEAKRELQRMPMQELSMDLQGYMSEQEASQVSAAMAIDAEQQSDRGQFGKIQMADIEQQRQARLDKTTDLEELQQLKAVERQDASDKLYDLNLAEAEGAQQAAADADNLSAVYDQQIVQSSMQAVQGAANLTGAVVGPKIEANEAYDNSIAPIGEANIKELMSTDPELVKKYPNIGTMTPDEVKALFMEAYPRGSWDERVRKYTQKSQTGGR